MSQGGLVNWLVTVWMTRVHFLAGTVFLFYALSKPAMNPLSFLSNGYQKLFPGGKAARAWSWPLTSV